MEQDTVLDDIFNGTYKSTPEQDAANDLKLKSLYQFHKEEINQEIKEIFLFAADVLEKQGILGKGLMFNLEQYPAKPCIMCAHGAIAYSDDTIRHLIDDGVKNYPAGINATLMLLKYPDDPSKHAKNLEPEEYLYGHYSSLGVAHYRAIKAGLTFEFNDGATLEEVVRKLREMANEK